VRHQEGLVSAGPGRRQSDQYVETPVAHVLLDVDPLVADHVAGVPCATGAEQAFRRKRLQELLHLAGDLVPGISIARVEQRPARTALDGVHDEQGPAPRSEQRAVGALAGAARERPERQRMRVCGAQRLQGVDPVCRQPEPLSVREYSRRPRPGPEQQIVVGTRLPGRPLVVHARKCAGHCAAVRKRLVAAAQAVKSADAREAHEHILGLEREFAQAVQRLVDGVPGRGRIDDQHGTTFAAELRGDHQHARADVPIARQGRDADEMHVLGSAQGKQAGASLGRSDHVVIREWRAVVSIGIGIDVADGMARAGAERAVRTLGRHRAPHANQGRFLQRIRHVSGGARHDGQAAENLLVLDVLRADGAHALHDEVETVVLVRTHVVVVHRGAERLARPRAQGLQR